MDVDYDAIMLANLGEVFGERNPAARLVAIRRLYAEDAVLYEPDRPVQGHDAIDDAVSALLATLPPEFSFTAVRPAIGHHGVGRLPWRAGPPDGLVAVTGLDVAHIEDGLIKALYVFLDPPEA